MDQSGILSTVGEERISGGVVRGIWYSIQKQFLKINFFKNIKYENKRLFLGRIPNAPLASAKGESKDWISELPNCILESILSLLTIKDAVHTSLISRRWRHLWLNAILQTPNLEFDIPNIFGSKNFVFKDHYSVHLLEEFPEQVFVRRVNKILQLYHGKKVDSFKVNSFLNGEAVDIIDEWIWFAITKGVEVLELHLFLPSTKIINDYVFPHWIFSELKASTLKHLSLRRCDLRPPPDFDRFNQLTTLSLNRLTVDGVFMAHVLSFCVFLEKLRLICCDVGSNMIVAAPPLLRLTDLTVLYSLELKKLEISAVNLVRLEYIGRIGYISFIKTPQIARIYYLGMSESTLPAALTKFVSIPGLETLHLNICLDVKITPQTVPINRNLKQLYVDLIFKRNGIAADLRAVLSFLGAAPLLEELAITLGGPKFHENQQVESNYFIFTHDHLKRVKIHGFQSNFYEIEFAICIIQNATKLETMVIDPFGKIYMGGGHWVEVIDVHVLDSSSREKHCRVAVREWEKKRRAIVQEKLKVVKTNAQVIIL